MRCVIQRVLTASVVVDGVTISSIKNGLMVLVGVGVDDTPTDSATIVKKILNLRVFDSDAGAWKASVMEKQYDVLCVSQFTLYARIDKGSKPDFHGAMSTNASKAFYAQFLSELGKAYDPARIKDGEFGAMMQVSLCNDGPVTITFDTKLPAGKVIASAPTSGTSTPALVAAEKTMSKEEAKEQAKLAREVKAEQARLWKAKKEDEAKMDSLDQRVANTTLES